MGNHTRLTVFILAGLTDDPQMKIVLFIFLLLTYLLSISGNLTIITLTMVDPHLKNPIYVFLKKKGGEGRPPYMFFFRIFPFKKYSLLLHASLNFYLLWKWRTKLFSIMVVLHNCFLPYYLEHLNFTSWQQCP